MIDLIPTNYIKSALNQDMLATVILALFIGMAMVAVAPERMKPLFEFVGAVQDISMKIIEWTGVDRILDMTRTTVNVSGDLTASVVMNRLLKDIE